MYDILFKFEEDQTETVVAIENDTYFGQTDRQTDRQTNIVHSSDFISVQCHALHWTDNKLREGTLYRCTDRYWPYIDTRANGAQNYTFGKIHCQCQSVFVNVAKIVKLFQSPRKRKMVGKRSSIVAVSKEMTSERGMSLDIDGRQAEKGKTECSTAMNSEGLLSSELPEDLLSKNSIVNKLCLRDSVKVRRIKQQRSFCHVTRCSSFPILSPLHASS